MSDQTTSEDIHNATSLQELQDGHTRYNSQDGQQTDRFGREAALVSHSVPPEIKKAKQTKGTSGQYGLN